MNDLKKIIKEEAGISFVVRKWTEIIYDVILDNPQEDTRIIIDGWDYPEAREGFKVDYFVIDYTNTITGYGHDYSGYDKDGNYVVVIYLDRRFKQDFYKSGVSNFSYNLKTALNHELKHAYQDYMRLSKGYPSIEKSKESKEMYTGDFIYILNNRLRGPIVELLRYYYYLSDLEQTAYLENIYDGNLQYEMKVREILSKNFDQIKNHPQLDENWYMVNTFDIPFLKKFKNPRKFIDYSERFLKRKAEKVIKKINKMKYIHNIS